MKLLFNPKTLTFTFKVPEIEQTTGVQKILGMAIGLKHHRVDYFPYWHRSNSILLGASAAVDNGPVKLWNYSYVDGQNIQKEMGVYEPKTELSAELIWKNAHISIYDKGGIKNGLVEYLVLSYEPLKPSKIGYLLHPYFETDAPENKRKPFDVRIWDVKCNGMEVEL